MKGGTQDSHTAAEEQQRSIRDTRPFFSAPAAVVVAMTTATTTDDDELLRFSY